MEELASSGAELAYHDPYVAALPELGLQSSAIEDAVADADAVVLVTVHPGIDHAAIARDAALFVDLRGATRGIRVENLIRL
jgi:UDP-N-acetyl-D-mannosaminuronate dehydrogenase